MITGKTKRHTLYMDSNKFFDYVTEKVRQNRKERKVSQLKLSLILGHSSTSYVARIELRKPSANYNLSHLYIIAKEFGLEVVDFIPRIQNITI